MNINSDNMCIFCFIAITGIILYQYRNTMDTEYFEHMESISQEELLQEELLLQEDLLQEELLLQEDLLQEDLSQEDLLQEDLLQEERIPKAMLTKKALKIKYQHPKALGKLPYQTGMNRRLIKDLGLNVVHEPRPYMKYQYSCPDYKWYPCNTKLKFKERRYTEPSCQTDTVSPAPDEIFERII